MTGEPPSTALVASSAHDATEARVTRTTCPYCGVGCGVEVRRDARGVIDVRGDAAHPANRGRLCSKGAALGETLGDTERLHHPTLRGERVAWGTALDLIASRFRETIDEHGPEAVAFYVSGQLLTEDYYVVNKFVKGWLGTANIDTNSRLCMASSVAGHTRAFGSDTVPGGYEDLEIADLVVLVGSNLAWCHPVIHQRLAAAKAARPEMRVVLIDPRRTATAELCDQHLALAPDSDALLFTGLLAHLRAANMIDDDWVAGHTRGLDEALAAVGTLSLDDVARGTGLTRDALFAFYALFTERRRTVTVYSQGVNQSERGTDTVNAIINCHLATGRIGQPGCGPFSITGQPNAMGGREVGGLANMLAAHMALDNAAHRDIVQRFWGSPRIADAPGPKAVELFERVHDGRIKALWVMATNPAVSLPDASRVREALARCPFVVVSDVARDTDTLRHATLALPAAAWSEKDGTVTNSERRVSRQRAFRDAPGEARPDWWALCEVAKRLGWGEAFDYADASAIFREHAALSAEGNDHGERDFDIGACARLERAAYDALDPFRWPWRAGEAPTESRFFGDGRFFTADGRGRFVPIGIDVASVPTARQAMTGRTVVVPAARVGGVPSASDTLVLNTGRVRDQWHTMTRTGYLARLCAHIAEPFVELHPLDAAVRGIVDADIVELANGYGRALVRALVSERQRPGSVFVPMHWSDAFAASARVDALVAPRLDPISGQPASKSTPVHVRRAAMRSHGFALLAAPTHAETSAAALGLDRLDDAYWAIAPCDGGWRVEFADPTSVRDSAARWLARLRENGTRVLAAAGVDGAPTIEPTLEPTLSRYDDARREETRMALFGGARLTGVVYLGPAPVAASRSFCAGQLVARHDSAGSRIAVLAGRASRDRPDEGAIVCSCFGVGERRILDAAAAEPGPCSVRAIGERVRAGSNCGSCRAEIAALLRTHGNASTDRAPVARTPRGRMSSDRSLSDA